MLLLGGMTISLRQEPMSVPYFRRYQRMLLLHSAKIFPGIAPLLAPSVQPVKRDFLHFMPELCSTLMSLVSPSLSSVCFPPQISRILSDGSSLPPDSVQSASFCVLAVHRTFPHHLCIENILKAVSVYHQSAVSCLLIASLFKLIVSFDIDHSSSTCCIFQLPHPCSHVCGSPLEESVSLVSNC